MGWGHRWRHTDISPVPSFGKSCGISSPREPPEFGAGCVVGGAAPSPSSTDCPAFGRTQDKIHHDAEIPRRRSDAGSGEGAGAADGMRPGGVWSPPQPPGRALGPIPVFPSRVGSGGHPAKGEVSATGTSPAPSAGFPPFLSLNEYSEGSFEREVGE